MGVESAYEPESINEHHTRTEYIDPELIKKSWLQKYIKEEVNTVKSDFNLKQFVLFDSNVERGVDRFADFVLLDEDYTVLTTIESNRNRKNKSGNGS